MESLDEAERCFPTINNSCRWAKRPLVETAVINVVLSAIILFTVLLNLLVIISISHFRQLQSTTNLLLLSLAVADFLVGALQMPLFLLHNQGCWLLGEFMCGLHYFMGFLVISVSVGSMVLISVDRYVAICEPMFYSSRVTLTRVKLSVCMCWISSVVHSSWILRDFLKHPNMFNSCYGDCVVVVHFAEGMVDLVVTFLCPFIIIVVLYLRVFVVAVFQARAMRSQITVVTARRSERAKVDKSELKAARTLGIVVLVFLLCSCPYYCFAVAAENNMVGSASAGIEIWFLYCNSTLNPIIYVFFYPWFRKTIKHIFTLQILRAGSREATVL